MDVSVIIPAYNRLWCLPRAINSCRHTKCRTEIIVVDDGSTDGTWEWLKDQTDIVAIRQENQGQTKAINNGFRVAKGEYIRFLDSDDFLCADTIDRQFNKAVTTKARLICSRVDYYDESLKAITQAPEITDWEDFLEIQLGNGYGSHFLGMLFHRSLVEKVPRRPDFAYREDRMFLLEVALLKPEMAVLEGCAGYWVQHQQQMQGNYNHARMKAVNAQHLGIYQKILAELDSRGQLKPEYKKAACTVLWPLAHWIAKYDIAAANRVVKWLYELDPEFNIPERGLLGMMYSKLGFNITERLLRVRRIIKYGWKQSP